MRILIAPYVSIVLSTSLVFLISGPQESCGNPVAIVKASISVLGPFIESFLGELRAKREAEKIQARVWMHTGDPKLNGCGFYFEVTGHSGKSKHDWFPLDLTHNCDGKEHILRMTSQSAMYSKKLRLGNDQTKKIELHADGFRDTFVKTMCFGLNERTIAGGPRAFCIDNDLLKACKNLTNKWNDIDLNTNDIKLTRTTRGTHKIIFNDVEKVILGFEAIAGNHDNEDTVRKICDHIELVRGGYDSRIEICAALTPLHPAGLGGTWDPFSQPVTKKEDIDPYGCDRFTDRK